MEAIFFGVFSITGLFSLLTLVSLGLVYIFIKEKKYWHLPGSILLVIAFAMFVIDSLTGSNKGYYALAVVMLSSVIESLVEIRKLTKVEMATDEEKKIKNTTLFWAVIWLFLKGYLVYFLLTM